MMQVYLHDGCVLIHVNLLDRHAWNIRQQQPVLCSNVIFSLPVNVIRPDLRRALTMEGS